MSYNYKIIVNMSMCTVMLSEIMYWHTCCTIWVEAIKCLITNKRRMNNGTHALQQTVSSIVKDLE